jgi:hypothetical protein
MTNTKLQLFRIEQGERVRYNFELDKAFTILSETRDDTPAKKEVPSTSSNLQTSSVEGIQTKVENGRTIITGVDDITQRAMTFFMDTPACDTVDCLELKKEIDKALEDAGGASCVGCKRGEIIRKFLPKIKEVLRANT